MSRNAKISHAFYEVKNQDDSKRINSLEKSRICGGDLMLPVNQIFYFPCYVMDLEIFFQTYEKESSIFLPWRELRRQKLIHSISRKQEGGSRKNIIFVSHQWLERDHPDPRGVQLRSLYKVLLKLRRGEYGNITSNHSVCYEYEGWSMKMSKRSFQSFLQNSCLWIDYQSVPQNNTEEECPSALNAAVKSIPAYIHNS